MRQAWTAQSSAETAPGNRAAGRNGRAGFLGAAFGVWLALGVILAVAAAPRLSGLDRASYDVDEYLHVFSAQAWLSQGKPLLPSGNLYRRAWPYTAAVAASFKAFGVNETAARLPSVAAGLLAVLAVFLIGREWFGSPAGLCAAALVAVGPLPVMTSRLCRMYAPFELVYVLAVFVLGQYVLFARSSYKSRLLPLLLGLALLAIAHTLQRLASVYVFALGAYLAGIGCRRPKSPELAAVFIGLLVLLAAAFSGRVDFHKIWEQMNFAPMWAEQSRYHAEFYWALWAEDFRVLMPLSVPFVIWLVFRHRALGWYLACMWAVPFAMHSLVFDWKFSRYVAHLFPLFALAVSPAIVALASGIWNRGKRLLGEGWPARAVLAGALAACGVLLAWPAPVRTVFAQPMVSSPDWRGAYAYVGARLKAEDRVVTSIPLAAAHYLRRPADYYLDNCAFIDFRGKMKQDAKGRWIDWYSSVPMVSTAADFAKVTSAHPHGWVVIDTDRFNADKSTPPEIRQWLSAQATPHADASDGTVVVYEWGTQP